jgi:hypothetical protein
MFLPTPVSIIFLILVGGLSTCQLRGLQRKIAKINRIPAKYLPTKQSKYSARLE